MLLVRKEGENSVIFSELRYIDNNDYSLKIPLKNCAAAAVKAVTNCRGIVEGNDYRGEEVLANIKPLKTSRWYLITKIDMEEIYSKYRVAALRVLFQIVIAILLVGAVLIIILFQERASNFKRNKKLLFKNLLLETQYLELTENANDMILLISDEGNILRANKKAIDIYGFSEDEFLKMKMDDLRTERMTDKLLEQINETSREKGFVFENIHKKKDGTKFPVEESLYSTKIKDIDYQQNIIRDLTEKKKLEKELVKREELATLGRVAGFLAHEIKSPLSGIIMSLEALLDQPEMPAYPRKMITLIAKKIGDLLNLMKEVQHYSSRSVMEFHPIKIYYRIEKIISSKKNINEGKSILFINSVEDIVVKGDPKEFDAMIIKLIENGIDAIEKEGTIKIYSSRGAKQTIEIYIKDSGEGIKETEKLFLPFFTTKSKGTGFGLPIAKKISNEHNGDIELVSSSPGATIFKLTLPLSGTYGENINNR